MCSSDRTVFLFHTIDHVHYQRIWRLKKNSGFLFNCKKIRMGPFLIRDFGASAGAYPAKPLWHKGRAWFVRATYCSVIGWSCLKVFLKLMVCTITTQYVRIATNHDGPVWGEPKNRAGGSIIIALAAPAGRGSPANKYNKRGWSPRRQTDLVFNQTLFFIFFSGMALPVNSL